MDTPSTQVSILVVGNDDRLAYLLARYAEQSGCQMIQCPVPQADEIRGLKPAVIIFSSLEALQTSQTLIEDLSGCEILVLACVALADEARAREHGADTCLVHPLSYDDFREAISFIYSN